MRTDVHGPAVSGLEWVPRLTLVNILIVIIHTFTWSQQSMQLGCEWNQQACIPSVMRLKGSMCQGYSTRKLPEVPEELGRTWNLYTIALDYYFIAYQQHNVLTREQARAAHFVPRRFPAPRLHQSTVRPVHRHSQTVHSTPACICLARSCISPGHPCLANNTLSDNL